MKKIIYILFLSFTFFNSYAQEKNNLFIDKGIFTKIFNVKDISYPADDFLTINVFYEMGEKAPWGKSESIISYRYLGIDNQTIRIERTENDKIFGINTCELFFKIENTKPTEITLIGQRSQINPLLIKLQIEVTNNYIKAKYLGQLPKYVD